jgi:hypothetical protein
MSTYLKRTVPVLVALLIAAVPAAAIAKKGHRHSHHARNAQAATKVSGKVESFAGGVLKIRQADNTIVSGAVTPQTEFECDAAEAPAPTSRSLRQSGDEGQADDNNKVDDNQNDGGDQNDGQKDDNQNDDGDQNDGADDSCDATALTAGAIVSKAKLGTAADGSAFWKSVELEVAAPPTA